MTAMEIGREATPEEEAALIAFMAGFEPVTMAPEIGSPPRSPYCCPCGRSVAKPRALCIRCGNTASGASWTIGHAQELRIPGISAQQS